MHTVQSGNDGIIKHLEELKAQKYGSILNFSTYYTFQRLHVCEGIFNAFIE